MNGYKYRANIFVDNEIYRDIDSLLKDELWASSLSLLNDPFEATYSDNIKDALKMLELLFKADTRKIEKSWKELIDFKEKVGVYSLALSRNNYPDNELMWAHYADSHKGFCIEYDIDKLEDSEEYAFNVNQMRIRYQNIPPIIAIENIKQQTDFLIKMFGTKSKSWEYEHEIRLLYSTYGLKKYNPFALKSIFFGLNMKPEFQEQIIEGLENRDVKFYKMYRKVNSYKLISVLVGENRRKIENRLLPSEYEILKTNHNHAVENFHVLYKGLEIGEEQLRKFVSKFREEHATKQANIYVYNNNDIIDLIDKYPISNKEWDIVSSRMVAESWFSNPNDVFVKSADSLPNP